MKNRQYKKSIKEKESMPIDYLKLRFEKVEHDARYTQHMIDGLRILAGIFYFILLANITDRIISKIVCFVIVGCLIVYEYYKNHTFWKKERRSFDELCKNLGV